MWTLVFLGNLKGHWEATVKQDSDCENLFYLVTPGKQQDLGVGVVGGGRHFDDDGLHHDGAVREVLDGVTFQHADTERRKHSI